MQKANPVFHSVTVTASERVTPNMQRIRFQGSDLSHITAADAGNYIKVLFNKEGGTDLSELSQDERPVMRTYTIRSVDESTQSIEVDFVVHQSDDHDEGFAAPWAIKAVPGDTLKIRGPAKLQEMYTDADWYFMVADMTALPACSAKVRQLPVDAKGYMLVQVQTEQDIQPIEAPEGMRLIWLTEPDSLIAAAKALPWLAGDVSVWSACEFESMKALRNYFRQERSVPKEHSYISSYWKRGVNEEKHKLIKRAEAEKDAA
jgi:NADPH-dependent ferric siderophore reductase